jgi:hypothetical protein
VKCPQGWKRAAEGDVDLTKCIQCKRGETTIEKGATSCGFCGLGQYGATAGKCSKCPTGQYQSEKKQTTCLTCKNGEIPNNKSTDCIKPTAYRIPSDCDYNNQYLNSSSPNKQEWECESCPLGGFCQGDIRWPNVQPKYGWWRLHDIVENNSYPPNCLGDEENKIKAEPTCAFQICLYPHACQGAPNPDRYTIDDTLVDPAHKNSSLTETCAETQGYSNDCTDEHGHITRCRLCATCKERYKRTGSGTRCKLCPDPIMNKVLLGVGFVVMLIGSAIMIYMEITSETSENETSDVVKKIIGKFSVLGDNLFFRYYIMNMN